MEFPYYSLRDGFNSTVLLVSDSPKPLDFVMAVRSRSGRTVLAPAMTIQPQEKLAIDLSELLAAQGADITGDFSEGSVAVYFNGTIMPLAGQLTMTNPAKNLSLESHVVDNSPGLGLLPPVLNAVWWALGGGRDARIMVTNTTDTSVAADVFLDVGGKRHPAPPLIFTPHETKVLSIAEMLGDLKVSPAQAPEGGITIIPRGALGTLIAQGKITDVATGFSTTLNFPDAALQHERALHASGVPIGKPSADSPYKGLGVFVPHVIVRNLTGTPQNVTITVEYPGADGPQQTVLSPLPRNAYSTEDIPLDSAFALLPLPLPFCSIRIQYSGPPGSAIAEVSSVESKGDLVIDSRLANEGDGWAGSGGHPWHLDEERESVLFLTNMGEQQCDIGFQMQAQGITYYVSDLTLQPRETRAIDLRKLRDAQKADSLGNRLPAGARDGSVLWIRLQEVPIMGRLVVFARHRGIASNYDCSSCLCASNFDEVDVVPSSANLLPGQSVQYVARIWYTDCNGGRCYIERTSGSEQHGPWWSSGNPGVAGVSSSGLVTGVSGGSTSIGATYRDNRYWPSCQPPPCHSPCNSVTIELSGGGTVNVLRASVDSINLPSDQVQVTVKGGSSTYQGSLLVTWNGPSGNANIASGTYAPGTYTFNPGLGSLVTGQYTGVTARWTLGGKTATGSRTSNFNVLGTYLHTQYNTPAESQCSGPQGPAYLTAGPPSCPWNSVSLIQNFVAQAWTNGSGVTINYGKTQEYLAGCAAPPGGNQNYFCEVSTITPSCGTPNNYLSGTTVAVDRSSAGHPLDCGDQVLIVGQGGGVGTVKTATDACYACIGVAQIDNYNTSSACFLGGNAYYKTIRLNH